MELSRLYRKMWSLRETREAIQAQLALHILARLADVTHLGRLRGTAEDCARQTDALISALGKRNVPAWLIRDAEDLRVFFRVAVGCTVALLDVVPSETAEQPDGKVARRGRR